MSDTPKMTFAIIKPDAVRAGNAGNIIQRITDNGFKKLLSAFNTQR